MSEPKTYASISEESYSLWKIDRFYPYSKLSNATHLGWILCHSHSQCVQQVLESQLHILSTAAAERNHRNKHQGIGTRMKANSET